MHDERRFVFVPAHWHGGEEGGIRLDEQAVIGHDARGLAHVLRRAEGDDAGNRDVEVPVEELAREGGGAREAVDYAAGGVGVPGDFVEHAERRVVRLARVDHHGKGELVRERKLAREEVALAVGGFGRVVEVKADLAYGRAGVGRVKGAHGVGKRFVRGGVARLVAVRAECKARRFRRERLGEKGGAVQLGRAAHGHEARDACRAGAGEGSGRFLAVFGEMRVRIVDVHRSILVVFGASLPKCLGRGKEPCMQILPFWTCTGERNVR